MSVLVPCPSCSRHVRSLESSCPFCEAALPTNLGATAVPAATRRLARLAAFTSAAPQAVTGCTVAGSDSEGQNEQDIGTVVAMYGMPPQPIVAGNPEQTDAGHPLHHDAGPHDAGVDANPCDPVDAGGFQAMYGMAPMD